MEDSNQAYQYKRHDNLYYNKVMQTDIYDEEGKRQLAEEISHYMPYFKEIALLQYPYADNAICHLSNLRFGLRDVQDGEVIAGVFSYLIKKIQKKATQKSHPDQSKSPKNKETNDFPRSQAAFQGSESQKKLENKKEDNKLRSLEGNLQSRAQKRLQKSTPSKLTQNASQSYSIFSTLSQQFTSIFKSKKNTLNFGWLTQGNNHPQKSYQKSCSFQEGKSSDVLAFKEQETASLLCRQKEDQSKKQPMIKFTQVQDEYIKDD